jgi:hypothetical protein
MLYQYIHYQFLNKSCPKGMKRASSTTLEKREGLCDAHELASQNQLNHEITTL